MVKVALKPPVVPVGMVEGVVAVTGALSTEMATVLFGAKPLPVIESVLPALPDVGFIVILDSTVKVWVPPARDVEIVWGPCVAAGMVTVALKAPVASVWAVTKVLAPSQRIGTETLAVKPLPVTVTASPT